MTRNEAPVSPPVVLTIAGSDSGGGAGIQADLKTIEATGGFGTSAITSVTAQNTRGVEGSHLLPIEDIRAQIDAVRSDFDVAAAKTGMLATADVIELVSEYAGDLPNLVVDPVMVAASGDRLLESAAEDAYEALVAESTLVTPNADEAAVLTDVPVEDEDSAVEAGRVLVEGHGATAALVKGGHVPGDTVRDVLVTEDGVTTIRHDRIETDATHGSGCTLSSAIATELAHGADLTDAVTAGIDLLASAVRYNVAVGEGPGAVHHLVALRDDAALGETIAALDVVPEQAGQATLDALAGPSGLSVAAATPYAEDPADTVTLGPGEQERGASGGRSLQVGEDGPAATALLAAREFDADLRFSLAGRYDDGVATALGRLDEPTTPSHEEGTGEAGSTVTTAVSRAFETGSSPVAIGLPDLPEPTTVVLAPTAERLAKRADDIADALEP